MPKKKLHIKEDFTPTGVMSLVDSNGQSIQITDSVSNDKLPDKLNVVVEATHTGINRNKVNYSYENLDKSKDSWTKDYNKPVLLNHDSSSDPLGRVKASNFKQSVINPDKHTIELNLEITNKAAIERFLDGRYSTFSIGGYTDSAVCSICGKDMMKDGFCGHRRGQTYDNKECYWNLGQMDYDEISVVNSPADVHAQAISLSVVGEDGQEDSIVPDENHDETAGEPTGEQGDSAKIDGNILDSIDNILGTKNSDGDNKPDEPESKPEEPESKPEDNKPTSAEEPTGEQGDSIESLKEKIASLENQVSTLQSEVGTKDGIIAAKDVEIETLSNERDELKAKLETSQEDSVGLVKQNAALAKFAHSSLAERVVDLQIVSGEKTLEDKEQLLKDYSIMTSKKLNDTISELYKSGRIHNRVRVINPGVVNDSTNADDDGFVKPNDQPRTVTLQDAVNTMKNYFVNRQI